MAGVSKRQDRDRTLDFEGFLNNIQDWDYSFKERDKKLKGQTSEVKSRASSRNAVKIGEDKEPPSKVSPVAVKQTRTVSEIPSWSQHEPYHYLKNSNPVGRMSRSLLDEESSPNAASEKELGNEYFKQNDFLKAIDCYSRSIALSPTSVAFANRAIAYLKIKRFEEAENDCTEALNLDDRYVKAYSRRATARKELGKLKASIEDSEFGMRLEPKNQELRKLYTETKALYEKEIVKKIPGDMRSSGKGIQMVKDREMGEKGNGMGAPSSSSQSARGVSIHSGDEENLKNRNNKPPTVFKEINTRNREAGLGTRKQQIDGSREGASLSPSADSSKKNHSFDSKHELATSVQELASRAAFRAMDATAKIFTTPKSAYELEVSWRALSDDPLLQARLLKSIPPVAFPQLFKSALSAPMLMDIIKCTASFFKEETELAISILDNLTKVPRFDMIVMCLSAMDRSVIHKIWEEVSSSGAQREQMDVLAKLQLKYCPGGWQMQHVLESNGWPK